MTTTQVWRLSISDGSSRNGGGEILADAPDLAAAIQLWRDWAREGDYGDVPRPITVRGTVAARSSDLGPLDLHDVSVEIGDGE